MPKRELSHKWLCCGSTHLLWSGYNSNERAVFNGQEHEKVSNLPLFTIMKRMANSVTHVKTLASIEDLVPANLAKARGDAVPIISAKYTKVGESIRRNAPQEVR